MTHQRWLISQSAVANQSWVLSHEYSALTNQQQLWEDDLFPQMPPQEKTNVFQKVAIFPEIQCLSRPDFLLQRHVAHSLLQSLGSIQYSVSYNFIQYESQPFTPPKLNARDDIRGAAGCWQSCWHARIAILSANTNALANGSVRTQALSEAKRMPQQN